jgi:hypothetical protein
LLPPHEIENEKNPNENVKYEPANVHVDHRDLLPPFVINNFNPTMNDY